MSNESIKLTRHALGSIDLSDLDDQKELSEAEQKEYCASIAAVFPRLEQDIKRFMYNQLLFSAKEAANWEQVIFSRGVLDGFSMLLEYWQGAHNEYLAWNQDKKFNKHYPGYEP